MGRERALAPASRGRHRLDETLTESDLKRWGRTLGRAAVGEKVFVALIGPLGAGKSTLARAALEGVGVAGPIPSPTYTLRHQYETADGCAIEHLDLYRIHSPTELTELGWDEILGSERCVFVEWADRAGDRLPLRRWDVRLEIGASPETRRLTAISHADAPPLPPVRSPC